MKAKSEGLSKRKKNFLENPRERPYSLRARDINILARYYKQKGIAIVKNGDVSRIILNKKLKLSILISHCQFKDLKYATFLQNNLEGTRELGGAYPYTISGKYHNQFSSYYRRLIELIRPYLSSDETIREDLTNEQLRELNKTISALPTKDPLRVLLDESLESYLTNIKREHSDNDNGLSKSEVWQEIKEIIATLKEGDIVGYVFTNGHRLNSDHFEVLLLAKDKIIKPIHWQIDSYRILLPTDIPKDLLCDMYVTDLSYFIELLPGVRINPQAGQMECGTLGLSYLKKLLGNEAEEYRTLSLACSFYIKKNDSEPQKVNFFLPSPATLTYSQSGSYNDALKALLSAEDIVEIKHVGKVTPLRKMLRESLLIASEHSDEKMRQHNEEMLARLDNFSHQWLDSMEIAERKRAEMKDKLSSQNRYLLYRTVKYEEFIEDKESNESYKSLKESIVAKIDAYINSRAKLSEEENIEISWLSRQFRNANLTTKKVTLAMGFKEQILQFSTDCTLNDLQDLIDEFKKINLSLEEEEGKKYGFLTKSGLARMLESIDSLIIHESRTQLSNSAN